jgi:hypothetical protein
MDIVLLLVLAVVVGLLCGLGLAQDSIHNARLRAAHEA